jgi:hypothetical protein
MKKHLLILLFICFNIVAFGQLTLINVGTSANSGTGDPLRTAFQKTNLAITQVNTNTTNIGLKLAKTDTTAMLSKYLLKSDSSGMLSHYIQRKDTSGMLSHFIQRKDTATMLTKYAHKASPTFTGTVSLPSGTSIGSVNSTELGYVDGVTSALQTQLGTKLDTTKFHSGGSGGSVTLVGSDAITLTTTGATSVTLPTTGTVAKTQDINDSLDVYIAGATEGVALADSSAFAKVHSYATGQMVELKVDDTQWANGIESNLIKGLQAMGSTIIALPLATTGLFTENVDLVDQEARYVAFYIPEPVTVTGVHFTLYTAGVFTADNYNGFGLYSVSGTTYTKITETADDGNIWKTTANTLGTKAFPSPQTLTPGLYYVALLWNVNAPTTAPNIICHMSISTRTTWLMNNNGNRLSNTIAGQTTLPASETGGDLSGDGYIPAIWLY